MHFTDLHEDPDAAIAARELDRMLRERYLTRLDAFYATVTGTDSWRNWNGSWRTRFR